MNVCARRLGAAGLVAGGIIAIGTTAAGPALAATTLVVDNASSSCSDGGPGTPARPLCTIGAAARRAVAGDTVLVSAGRYRGTSVDPARSGTSARPITFTAGRGVRITGGPRAFALSGRSDIVISGFVITGTTSYGISVSGGRDVVIARNTVSFAGRPVPGSAAAGIYVRDLKGGQVSGNATHDNSSHGIYLLGTTTGVRVQGNRSYHNAYQYERNASGIEVNAPGNTIVHNVTYANEDSGINVFPGANRTVVTGNVSYDNGDHGIDNLDVSGGRITGNTVFRNCTSGINVEGTSSYYFIENNVAADNATGTVINPTPISPPHSYTNDCNRRDGNIGVFDSAPATTDANFNLVWQDGAGAEYVWAGTIFWDQSELTEDTGQEARGIFASPMFADPANWNLRLRQGSPAIDSANSAAPGEQLTDILGRRRVDDPAVPNTGGGPRRYDDRGAYEFQP
ncbi:MAG TPA: right-handed parallel beta-helix repeat-containing protein [Streptosporangiaceae bacterium]|nr:right-handed parallel beta-helix repeat-containing protein [Streptosporangiaceae bacterium]